MLVLATLGWVGKRPYQPPSSPMSDVAPRAEALVVDGSGVESQLYSEPRTYL